jgi:hypothetical protein
VIIIPRIIEMKKLIPVVVRRIAVTLGIGIRTVETHRERIMRKLDIHSVARLTAFALATRIVSNPFLEPVKEESLSTPTLQALTA